jgi:hypothetical protein
MLKPQDIVILLKMAVQPAPYSWSYNQLAYELHMSSSEVHAGVKRAGHARLFDGNRRRPVRRALEEFLVHGVKYAFAPEIGTVTRGVPTAEATPALKSLLTPSDEIFVWPHPEGPYRGIALSPLYRTVPGMIAHDDRLYQALGVLDAIRIGRARDVQFATKILLEMLRHDVPD